MNTRLLLRVIAILFAGLVFQSTAIAEEVTFNKPKNGSYRLDWCYKWAVQCGEVAADKFCQKKGYDGSSVFAKANDIGGSTPTRVLGTGQVCDDDSCDGFKFITCENTDAADDGEDDPDPPVPAVIKKDFLKPSLNGQRIHYCFKPSGGCGKKAADAFCDIQGYDEAVSFAQSNVLLGSKAPRFIGSGQICSGLNCVGFKGITCRKEP
jgi:hypothetical protein